MKKDKSYKQRPTRGILQARFLLPDGNKLTVFGVHFPSQGSPTPFRKKAVETLNRLQLKLPKSEYVIAAGDFNITTKEDAKEKLFTKDLASQWMVSHQIGCAECEGTHNYRGSWSFLDAILFSKNFKYDTWKVIPKSIRVANKSLYQLNYMGGPERFNDGRGQKGVSDHFPMAADIVTGSVK